jgi:Hemerythrin HHE cation binding domain
MKPRPSDLFEAFKEDHAVLGRGLHEISEHLRGGDLSAAKASGERIDRQAGAHVAFEERFFYPALRRLLGDAEVDRLYREHCKGASVIKALVESPEGATVSETQRRNMLQDSEAMETHIAECGELFGAMGRIPFEEQQALYRELLALRAEAPRWTEFAMQRESNNRKA